MVVETTDSPGWAQCLLIYVILCVITNETMVACGLDIGESFDEN